MNPQIADLFHPDALLAAQLFALIVGLFFGVSGRISTRVAQGVTLIALVVLFGVSVRYGALLVEQEQFDVALVRGWLLPKTLPGSIQVGFLFGRAGFFVGGLVSLFGLALALVPGPEAKDFRVERKLAAVLFGVLGVSLSWISVSLWESLAGVGLAVLGGFFSIGARWWDEEEATLSTRFVLERVAPLGLAFAGAASLASHSVSLVFDASGKPGMVGGGAFLLLLGLILLVPQVPLLSSLIAPSRQALFSRTLLVQALPALAVAGVFFQLSRTYQSPLFSAVASILVLSASLTGVVGLAQADWRRTIGAWVSAGVSLAIAAFLSAEPVVGLSQLLPAVVAPLLIAWVGESEGPAPARGWLGLLGLLATGWPGSVAIAGAARWWWAAHEGGSGAVLLVFLAQVIVALLVWRVIWSLARRGSTEAEASPRTIWGRLGMGALVLPLIGLLWIGSLTGGAWLEDQWFGSFIASLFAPAVKLTGEALQTTAFYHGVSLVLGAALGYWLTGTAEGDRWLRMKAVFPRLSAFLESAYGSGALLKRTHALLVRAGAVLYRVFDGGLWHRLLPSVSVFFRERFAPSFATMDALVRWKVGNALSRLVALPGQGLQAVQSGDLQWYLFFALTVGIGFVLIF